LLTFCIVKTGAIALILIAPLGQLNLTLKNCKPPLVYASISPSRIRMKFAKMKYVTKYVSKIRYVKIIAHNRFTKLRKNNRKLIIKYVLPAKVRAMKPPKPME